MKEIVDNTSSIFRNKILLFILLIGLGIKICFFVSLNPWQEETIHSYILVKGSDALEYDQLAKKIIHGDHYKNTFLFRPPGYPAFLALNYTLFSYKIFAVFIVQMLLSILSAIILFKIIYDLNCIRAAYWGTLLFLLDPFQSLYNMALMTETVFVFLFLSSLYCLFKGIKDAKYALIICAGILIGLAALVRPIIIFFPIVLLALLLTNVLKARQKKEMIVYSLTYLLTLSPFAGYNYAAHGEFQISSLKGRKLFLTNVAYAESLKTGSSLNKTREELLNKAIKKGVDTSNFESFENSVILTKMSKEYIRSNFKYYALASVKGIVDLYSSFYTHRFDRIFNFDIDHATDKNISHSYAERIKKLYANSTFGQITLSGMILVFLFLNYIFAVLGFYSLLKNKKLNVSFFILIFSVLYFSLITGPMGDCRFRTSFMPIIHIFAAIGIAYSLFNEKSIVNNK